MSKQKSTFTNVFLRFYFECFITFCSTYTNIYVTTMIYDMYVHLNLRQFCLCLRALVLFLFQLDFVDVDICLLLKHIPHHSSVMKRGI